MYLIHTHIHEQQNETTRNTWNSQAAQICTKMNIFFSRKML